MQRLLLTVFFLIIISIPAEVFALSAPITSPYGWRIHPITGTERYHSGVDLGVDEGTPLTAIMPGTVTVAGWMSGYGIAVMIDHGNGMQTLFGHCSQVFVSPGQEVSAGMLVAASGNTGDSTGPHLHFELRVNGKPTDPMPLILQAGWDITGEPLPGDIYNNSDYDEMPWNFGDFIDVASKLREILDIFATQCTDGLQVVQQQGAYLLAILMTIDLALTLVKSIVNNDDFFATLISKILFYGFVSYLYQHWQDFINYILLGGLIKSGAIAAGASIESLTDPSTVVQKGVYLVTPVFNFLTQYTGAHMIVNVHHVFVAMILGILILVSFIIMGLLYFITYIEFYIYATLTVVLIPFGILEQTKFIGENAIGTVVNSAVKLMVMTFVINLIVNLCGDQSTTNYDHYVYLTVTLASIALTALTYLVPKSIAGLLASSPKL